MRLPRRWVLSLGLLATAPSATWAGPVANESATAPAAASSSNQETAKKIATALKKAGLSGKGIALEYKNGNCVITGEASDPAQRALATKVISSVEGVKNVDNRLSVAAAAAAAPGGMPALENAGRQPVQQVNHVAGRSNQEVAQGIADALSSSGLSGYDIEVRFSNGVASLAGNVDSPVAAQKALECAYGVDGVQQVSNRLTVQGQPVAAPSRQAVMPAGYPQMAQAPMQGMQAPMMAMQPGMPPQGMMPGQAPSPMMSQPGVSPACHLVYNQPNLPQYAWPSYAQYVNSAAVSYPSQYDASAFPYIGPYYPYPQVPLGWREATLEWDDGYWNLKFNSRTDRWWWFMNPHNWSD